ncbi:NAD(P)-binding domain-containing protein [Nostoc sp. FACHB-280]|uniref:NAD(P)-binding domain-containing protein n=1 Tax=Nostoc sp. FACHB-280 TaxID=2692839 RepID=UPI00168BB109|nr:FAD/NAD(P)-binding protein [Nostoc sp. FACHB-280]MBD2498134.1 SidA/IucD/PvdA family monooxygenase [Nostoc sp. FACHB-280]
MTNNIDLAIVGAGPHALTLTTHLLQKRQSIRGKFSVFDPSGMWLSGWKQQFTALEIPHLRSPAVHHPDPNPFALRKFAESRPQELFPPYDLPGTKLFEDFCQDVIRAWQLQEQVIPLAVKGITPFVEHLRPKFRLDLQDGQEVIARRVVLATGGFQIQLPNWVKEIPTTYPPDKLCHSQNIDLRKSHLTGKKVLIVGGGLTSGHLAIGAISRGAKVHLLIRRNLAEKLFDAESGWLGPKYLKDFFAQSNWEKRWTMIQQARNGGSMTPAIATQLRRQVRTGNIRIDEQCQVIKAEWLDENWRVECSDNSQHKFDYIWLSTGTKFDVTTEPLLTDILAAYPIPVIKGLPVLDTSLRWPGCELFIMGGLAALQIGPTARNLSGARMACEKIVPAIVKPSVSFSPSLSTAKAS